MITSLKKYSQIKWPWIIFGVLSNLYLLFFIFKLGYVSDDAYNSMIRGLLRVENQTLFEYLFKTLSDWILKAGRFFPVGFYHIPLYYYVQSVLMIKIINWSFILLGVLLFSYFLAIFTRIQFFFYFGLISLPVFFQTRLWHDPILAFSFLIPFCFSLLMASCVFFTIYLNHKKKNDLISSVVFYVLCLGTYEIIYPFSLLFFIIAFFHPNSLREKMKTQVVNAFKVSTPFWLLSFLFLALHFFLKSTLNPFFKNMYPGASLHLDFEKIFSTLVLQLYSAVPLSYHARVKLPILKMLNGYDFIYLITLCGALVFLFSKIQKKLSLKTLLFLLCVGSVLWFVPALVISVSGHQEEIMAVGRGFGYLPVYIEYFGCYLVFFALFQFLRINPSMNLRWLNQVLTLVMCLILTYIAGIHLGQNRAVTYEANQFYKFPREMLQAALESGLLQEASDGAVLVRNGRFPSDHKWFYAQYTGKVFNTFEPQVYVQSRLPAFSQFYFMKDVSNEDVWLVTYQYDKKAGLNGNFFSAKLKNFVYHPVSKEVMALNVERLSFYQYKTHSIQKVQFRKEFNFLKLIQKAEEDPLEFKEDIWYVEKESHL